MILLSSNSFLVDSLDQDSIGFDQNDPPYEELKPFNLNSLERNRTINLYFLGLDEDNFDVTTFQNNLLNSYRPIDILKSYNSPQIPYLGTYEIDYTFTYLDTNDLSNFVNFANSIAQEDIAPLELQDITDVIQYYPSDLIENYLSNTYSGNQSALFFINTVDDLNHQDHLYSSTSIEDIDNINQMRHIAGGGKNSSTLWLDLSQTNTTYRNSGFDGYAGVNSTLIPAVSSYPTDTNGKIQLAEDLAFYTQSAIELRFLASLRHDMIDYKSNIQLYYTVFVSDIATTAINTSPLLSNLASTIKNNYFLQNVTIDLIFEEYSSFPTLNSILQNSYSASTGTYDPNDVKNFLDDNFDFLTPDPPADTIQIPGYVFVLPDNRSFDGINSRIFYDQSDNPIYSFLATSEDKIDLYQNSVVVKSDTALTENSTVIMEVSNTSRQTISTVITNSGDPLEVQILDEYNYNRYQNDLSFTPLISTGIAVSDTIELQINQTSSIYWIFNSSSVNFDYDITIQNTANYDYLDDIYRHIGAFIGLSHPAYGYTEKGNKLYSQNSYQIFYLWDQSTSMIGESGSYSIMDSQIIARSQFANRISDLKTKLSIFYDQLNVNNSYIPPELMDSLSTVNSTIGKLNNITDTTYWWYYLSSIDTLLIQLNQDIEELQDQEYSQISHLLTVSFNSTSVEQFDMVMTVNDQIYKNQSYLVDVPINLTEIGYAGYSLNILIQNTTYYQETGFTWDISSSIKVNVSDNVTQRRTIPFDTPPITADPQGSILTYLWLLVPVLAIPIVYRKYYKN